MPAQPPIADRYELKEPLGEGGMGIVYRAFDQKTKSYVALKTMRDASDPVAVELFSKEWGVLASISHPNIVPIRDVGELEQDGQKIPFFVMPLLPGVPLAQLIETSSARLSVDRVVQIISQVCRGLQAAHERGLVHRDIKPTNIFVMEDDTAQIIDFGVVYLAGSQSVTGLKGTWQYMAPEQIDLKPASPVSDLFSLGVVCYEALTGRRPFARKTPGETAEAIRSYIPPPVSEINPSVSQVVSMAIHKAMAKQPMHRYSSARDFGDTLQRAYRNEPIDRFDRSKIQPRIDRAKKAFEGGDSDFASEILAELESEGHIDPEIALVRARIDQARRQKKIRQLLEAARTRLEQEEIPLAFEKLQEVLEIDPENTDALAMRASVEKQRNERQIESWMSLARRHLERHDYAEARQALAEVLKIRSSDSAALNLLDETQRREQEAVRIRSEKEQLYSAAQKDYGNGEISTALSKLERLLDLGRKTADATQPEREAIYQGFYNQVRSDRDSIHNAYEEARRHLGEKNFARALQICDEFIAQYPSDAMFQALKLEAVEQQRQELSAFIVEVGHRLDAEADLDRKVNLLKEACERYPNEQQFQQSLKLTRERRDLVLSIVAKARYHEEKGLFAEALGQWDILRNIYPRYPGIDIEVAQLQKRRDEQARDEAKARIIEQIDRSLDSGDFVRACDLAAAALAEYPEDQEVIGLERLARQGMERSSEAGKLCAQAQTFVGQGQFPEAVHNLRSALELDPKNRVARETLVNILVEQARPLAEGGDWQTAESLVQQASELDSGHTAARSVRALITDGKRKAFVAQCLSEARDLQLKGDAEAALAKIEAGLVKYPNEPRLVQLQTTLLNGIRDVRRQRERTGDLETLREISQTLAPTADPATVGLHLQQARAISEKHPDDPEIGSVFAEIRHRVGAFAETTVAGTSALTSPLEFSPTITVGGQQMSGSATGAATQPARIPEPAASGATIAQPNAPAVGGKRETPTPVKGLSRVQLVGIGAVIFLIMAAIVFTKSKNSQAPGAPAGTTEPAENVAVQVQVTPPGSTVTVNGEVRSGTIHLPPGATYKVVVSKLGYRTQEENMQPQSRWIFNLDPAPVRLNLSTSEKAGKVFVDDAEKADLQTGLLQDVELPADGANHVLALRNGNREILSLTFSAKPGEGARVSNVKPKDLIVVSSLGNEATVYSGSPTLKANVTGQELQPVPADGLRLSGVGATANEVIFSNADLPKVPIDTGNSPVLYVGLNADTNIAYLNVQSNVPASQLIVEGVEIKASKPGMWRPIGRKPGKYTLLVKAEGYEDHQEQIELVRGKATQRIVELKPKVVAPTVAYLVIEGGTAGAEVMIDGAPARALDASGSARLEVTPGPHKVSLRKDFFEPSGETQQNFTRAQEIKLGPGEAKLKEFGTLQFKVTPAEAQINYRRSDQSEPQHVRGRESVRVPEGRYTITVESAGLGSQTREVTVAAGQTAPIELALTSEAKGTGRGQESRVERSIGALFERPEQITATGDWWKGTSAAEYAFLKPGVLNQFNLAFSDPGKNFLRRQKRVEWVVGYAGPQDKVVYEFDGRKLNRKAYVGGKSQNATVNCQVADKAFQFQVSIQSNRVVVQSSACDQPDAYESAERDLTKGKIGVKPNAEFIIR